MGIIKNYQSAKGTCKVTFSYPTVDGVKSVQVMGDFNNWDSSIAPKMKKSKDEFSTVIELKAGAAYEFRYLLDAENWDNDFNADYYVSSPYMGINNSVLVLEEVEVAKAPVVKATKSAVKEVKPKADSKGAKAKVSTTPEAKPTAAKSEPVAKATKKVGEPKKVVAKPVATKPVVESKPKAVKVTATKSTSDDLTKIEGIGPKIATLLVEKGIKTFAELSKAKESNLKSILTEAGSKFQMHDPSTWAQQATLAAKGNWDALKTLQDQLNGGKK